MKLNEIKEERRKGTYAAVHFDDNTKQAIKKYIEENNIPNAVPVNKLHTTLLYSRKFLPDYVAAGKVHLVGQPTNFENWPTQDKQSNCLVLKYDCPDLVKRHKFLMKEHGATFDYDEFKPHVTLSYDIGDMDIKDLPKFEDDIVIVEEYSEDLDLNWAKKA